MRFPFCGGLNAPEWFLAQSAVLSKLPVIKLLLIVKNYIAYLLDGVNKEEKIDGIL
jgi:hypothetical protein